MPDVAAFRDSGAGEGPSFLALEWVEPGALSPAGAEAFGRGLASLHSRGAPAHGWLPDGGAQGGQRIGSLLLTTEPRGGWADFYAYQRLLPLARIAAEQGSLDHSGSEAVAAVCERIEELAGPDPSPARLHGDLWGGNVLAAAEGSAWLIDPSAQGGHPEMDLAMLRLFGAPGGERVFRAYAEVSPLEDGHEDRVALWQLQPLLVHAVLFGGSYGRSVESTARSLI